MFAEEMRIFFQWIILKALFLTDSDIVKEHWKGCCDQKVSFLNILRKSYTSCDCNTFLEDVIVKRRALDFANGEAKRQRICGLSR